MHLPFWNTKFNFSGRSMRGVHRHWESHLSEILVKIWLRDRPSGEDAKTRVLKCYPSRTCGVVWSKCWTIPFAIGPRCLGVAWVVESGVPADIVTDHQRFGVRIFVLADFMLVPEELIMVSLNTKSADKDTRRSYIGTSNEIYDTSGRRFEKSRI